MAGTALDLQFGWRWLLPAAAEGGRMRLYGFSEEEERFLRAALPAGEPGEGGHAEVLLVDGVRALADAMPPAGDVQSAHLVCMLVSRGQARRWRMDLEKTFPHVREYGLLPFGNPRVAVPLSSSWHVTTALSLHRPLRWGARLGLMLAKTLAAIGNFELLRGRVLLIATRSREFVPKGALQAELPERLGQQATDYALYLGAPHDNRMTVILPLGNSSPSIILKVASTPAARASLRNEAALLSTLSKSHLAAFVPRLEGLISTDEAVTLYQEYRQRRPIGHRKMDAAVAEFLAQLMLLEHDSVALPDLLAALPANPNVHLPVEVLDACRALHRRLQHTGESGAEVRVHRTHGDFTPGNCAWTDQGLFVFDWEKSRGRGLALGDGFYFAIAPALFVRRKRSVARTLDAALRLGDRVACASGVQLDSRVYLALWLLGRVGKANLYGELAVMLERRWK